MSACLQILVKNEWRWTTAWHKETTTVEARRWATAQAPDKVWRLLRHGPLGVFIWTCSPGAERMSGMFAPPVFVGDRLKPGVFGVAASLVDAALRIRDLSMAASAIYILKGDTCNYAIVRDVYSHGNCIEIGERVKGTRGKPRLIYGSSEEGFLAHPLGAIPS